MIIAYFDGEVENFGKIGRFIVEWFIIMEKFMDDVIVSMSHRIV